MKLLPFGARCWLASVAHYCVCVCGNGVENRFSNRKNVRPNAETRRKRQQQQTQMKRNSEIQIKIFSFERNECMRLDEFMVGGVDALQSYSHLSSASHWKRSGGKWLQPLRKYFISSGTRESKTFENGRHSWSIVNARIHLAKGHRRSNVGC